MPSSDDSVDFRQKYRNLKKKFKLLIYENECFQEELRKAQRKLLKVSRDKSFLLDRLLQYESVDSTSSDSDATESSDSDSEQKHELPPLKKKKPNSSHTEPVSIPEVITPTTPTKPPEVAPKKKKPPRKTPSKTSATVSNTTTVTTTTAPIVAPTISTVTPVIQPTPTPPAPTPAPAPTPTLPPLGDGHMTSEEIERHLEAKQALRDLLPEKAPLTVPAEMFSTEPSNLDSDLNDSAQGLDSPPNRGIDDDLAMSLPDKYDV